MLTPTKREGAGSPLAAEARFEPEPGVVVAGKYRIERVIGEGGMGVVVAATHEGLEQRVAIKFLLPEAMRNKEAVERFLREAKVAAKVKSEHVARVSDVGTVEGGAPFIVMEHLEGDDLGALIDRDGQLPVEDTCEIGLQACEALAEVHAAGIVHRDLKPSNLFVTRRADGSPCVKLLDFGISKFTVHPDDSGVDPALTATATIMGSPSYMSPEQLKSTKEVDARTDVWSLGAVLYEAMTGKPAFRGETVVQVCAMIVSEEPAPPSGLRSDLPPELERAVLGCLEKKAAARATLVELARALVKYAPDRARASLERVEAVMGEERSLPSPPVGPRSIAEVARTQASWGEEPKKRGGGGGLLLLLALVAGAVFGVGVYSGRIDLRSLRGQVASATSAAASVVAPATTAAATAVVPAMPVDSVAPARSALPPASVAASPSAAPVASDLPLPSASATPEPEPSASDEADDEEPPPAVPGSAAAVAPAVPRGPSAPRAAPPRRLPPRPRHGVNKYVHKHH